MLQQEQQLLRAVGGGYGGQVKLGASMAFEQAFFFERVVAPFGRKNPDVLLSLRFGHSVELAEAVLRHDLDLGYLLGWHIPSGLSFKELHESKFVFLVAQHHPLADRDTVSVDDIAEAGLITAPLDHVEWAHYGDVLHHVGLGPGHVTLEIDGIQARALAADAGLGVLGTFYPTYAGATPYGALVPLPLDRPAPTVDVGLVTRRGDMPPASVRGLADWIQRATRDSAGSGL